MFPNRGSIVSRKWLLLCAVFLVLLVGGSFIPLAWKVQIGTHGPLHRKVHVLAFAACGIVACLSARNWFSRLWRAAGLVFIALGIEVLQSLLFGDRFEWSDVTADATGTAAALLLTQALALHSSRIGESGSVARNRFY